MTDSADDAVAIGIAAWARLRDHERATWADWLDVARALAIGRTAALKIADTNRPLGTRYNMAMGVWLRENGLDGVVAQERYRLLLILQNIEAIEIWRADLDEAQRRGLSHPNSVSANWRRHTANSARSTPAVRHHIVRPKAMPSHRNGRPIYFGQDALRRAAMALRQTHSNDIFVLARAALEAAIRTETDLIVLLEAAQPPAA